jgi:hypothetical protein
MSTELATCPILALPEVTVEKWNIYLTHLALTGRKWKSATLACIPNPRTFFRHLSVDECPDRKQEECEALQQFCEMIEEAIQTRAINGVPKGIYWQGQLVATEFQYSDTLLLAMAKRHIREYQDRMQIDATVKAGVLLVATPLDPVAWEETYGKSQTNTTRQSGGGDQQYQTSGSSGKDHNPGPQG